MKILVREKEDRKIGKFTNCIPHTVGRVLEVEIAEYYSEEEFQSQIKRFNPDILITFNLTGFEQRTLAGSLAYNLLKCKQIHFLLDSNLKNEEYLKKQLSISMFFYCVGEEYYNYLKDTYPDLPYLKELKGWSRDDDQEAETTNANLLYECIQEIMKECHLD